MASSSAALDAYSLKLITKPTVWVASPDDVLAWAQNKYPDEASIIRDRIKSATEMVEQFADRVLCDQTWELRLPRFPGVCGENYSGTVVSLSSSGIKLPKGPWQSITYIKYYASDGTLTTLSSSNYLLDDATGWVTPIYGGTWPSAQERIQAVQIRYLSGYGPLPTDPPSVFKDAVIETVQDWLENRHGRFQLPPGVKEKLAVYWPGTVI